MSNVYRVGAELASIRNLRGAAHDNVGHLRSFQRWLGNVDIEPIRHAGSADPISEDQRFLASPTLGLLQRGCPTISSPAIEESLLRTVDPTCGFEGSFSAVKDEAI